MRDDAVAVPISMPTAIERGERPSLAVWKFASCDGCQLSLLDCEDDIMQVADRVVISYFPEAATAMVAGPYDVSLVEGSITTAHDVERIEEIRQQSHLLVTLGACATAGGIQALRNGRDIAAFTSIVYAHPGYIETLATSTPIADHVRVDLELRGCPIDRSQLLRTLAALLNRQALRLPTTSVCVECKARSTTCVMVAHGTPCLGPVTQAGCDALCPSFHRGCYGCFGPMESPNVGALRARLVELGLDDAAVDRLLQTFNVSAFAALDPPAAGVPRSEGEVGA
jgi:coenzyme F420-reducing hydrogenase gamma subunit